MGSYVFYLVMLLIVVVFLRVDFYFTVLYFLFAVWVLGRAWTRRAAEHLEGGRSFVDRAFTGDRVRVDLWVKNEGWLPVPWVEVTESLPVQLRNAPPDSQVVSLGAKQEWRTSYHLACRQRGVYNVGPLNLQTGDLLGMLGRVVSRVQPGRMVVYPRVLPLGRLGLPTLSPLAALPARSPLFEDASRIMGVRDYQRGDSYRRVHWPATARSRKLVVKQYQPAIARETVVCLDMDAEGYDDRRRYEAVELAVVAAASVASHVAGEGQPVGLLTEAYDPLAERRVRHWVPPKADRGHLLMGVLETLARVQPTPEAGFAEAVRQASVRFSWGATVVLITGRESDALYDIMVGLRRAGFPLALILVNTGFVSPRLRERAGVLGARVHRVWTEQELEGIGGAAVRSAGVRGA